MPDIFPIVVKNDRFQFIKIFQRVLLVVISICLFIAAYIKADITGFIWPALILVMVIASFYQHKARQHAIGRFFVFIETGFLWAIAGSYFLVGWWMALIAALAALSALLVKDKYTIIVSGEGVHILSFPRKEIKWTELSNVVLKADLLTIDFKNNRLLQAEYIPLLSHIGDAASFNEFCKKQLTDKL